MKKNNFTSSPSRTKDDNNNKGVERKQTEFMRNLLHHDTETSENVTTKTRTRERGWIDDTTRKEHHHTTNNNKALHRTRKRNIRSHLEHLRKFQNRVIMLRLGAERKFFERRNQETRKVCGENERNADENNSETNRRL